MHWKNNVNTTNNNGNFSRLQPLTADGGKSNTADGGKSNTDLTWKPTTGFDMTSFMQSIVDPTSWWSHGCAAVLVVLIAVVILVATRPSFAMERSADGVITDTMSIPKLFGVALTAGVVCLGITLWVHGIPSA